MKTYEVWEDYYDPDTGEFTQECVMIFETYEEAFRFAETLMKDPNCNAWIRL